MDYNDMTNEALASAHAEKTTAAAALFALTAPTIAQVDEAEALMASLGEIETVQRERASAVADAEARFSAARAKFSTAPEAEDEAEAESEDTEDEDAEDAEDEDAEAEAEDVEVEAAMREDDETSDEEDEPTDDEERKPVKASVNQTSNQTIRASAAPRRSAAQKVARQNKRREVSENHSVTITAAADVPQFSTGQALDGMEDVTKALINRTKGFPSFNLAAANGVRASGETERLHKFGVASFGITRPDAHVAALPGSDYGAVRAAIKDADTARFSGETLTAAGWCAPSETVYSFIADYVVDGLITVPEVSAPRGGLNITTGPARSSQGQALADHGFVQTEAQAEAGATKTCETIVCPDFEDHRLDAIGHCYKIPLLTQKAYPELITDALRFANVLYAHKVNQRVINDIVGMSTATSAVGLGASFTDTLEALSIIAVKERRKWNLGVSAVMEVKLPEWVREVFRADMSRRQAVAVDAISDQQIDAHFSARRLAVEYVADWQELTGASPVFNDQFDALIYPSGTFIKAVEDVINLTAVYDAASLSVNEYTGVFFEQGILVAQAGYGSTKVSVPVCTAGLVGAAALNCVGSI